MMKYFYTLLFASLALNIFAGVPRLSHSDLPHATIIADHLHDALSMADAETVQSLQQFMCESNRTLEAHRLKRTSSRGWSVEELTGAKIATAYAFNFEWNNSTGEPEIIETDYAMMGMDCILTSRGSNMYISEMYGDFSFPIHIDLASGAVTIEAGKAIATLDNAPYNPNNSGVIRTTLGPPKLATNWTLKKWTLYAMPLSRLMGDDSSEIIHGQVNEDGTISFSDDFAFLVCQEVVSEGTRTWGLSPIYKNLTLLNPNGTHKFQYTRLVIEDQPGPVDHGHGGLVPRNTKPGSSKPISGFAPVNLGEIDLEGNPRLKTGNDRAIDPGSIITPTFKTTTEVRPVYWEMSEDDSTLIVYNLYGLGNRCYIKFNGDGTIELPRQQIYNDGLGKIYYGNSCTATRSQDCIMWGEIFLKHLSLLSDHFDSNLLHLTGASIFNVPQEPILSFAEHDTSVEFYATTVESDGIEVILYMYDEEAHEYLKVENPLSVQRLDTPYGVYLAAEAYNTFTGLYSEVAWFDYEVPALESAFIRGDVNDDQDVDISDVTAMIDGLLSGNWDSRNYDNADCNQDGDVDISDVTALIDYLLSGHWPD